VRFAPIGQGKPQIAPAAVDLISGLEPRIDLHLLAVDPVQALGRVAGVIRKKACVTQSHSLFAPNYTDRFSPVVSMFGPQCNIIQGNSGSAVFDSRGVVRAVVSAGLKEDATPMGSGNFVGVASNTACIRHSRLSAESGNAPTHPSCRRLEIPTSGHLAAARLSEILSRLPRSLSVQSNALAFSDDPLAQQLLERWLKIGDELNRRTQSEFGFTLDGGQLIQLDRKPRSSGLALRFTPVCLNREGARAFGIRFRIEHALTDEVDAYGRPGLSVEIDNSSTEELAVSETISPCSAARGTSPLPLSNSLTPIGVNDLRQLQ
jgi:hypothetical protein